MCTVHNHCVLCAGVKSVSLHKSQNTSERKRFLLGFSGVHFEEALLLDEVGALLEKYDRMSIVHHMHTMDQERYVGGDLTFARFFIRCLVAHRSLFVMRHTVAGHK